MAVHPLVRAGDWNPAHLASVLNSATDSLCEFGKKHLRSLYFSFLIFKTGLMILPYFTDVLWYLIFTKHFELSWVGAIYKHKVLLFSNEVSIWCGCWWSLKTGSVFSWVGKKSGHLCTNFQGASHSSACCLAFGFCLFISVCTATPG